MLNRILLGGALVLASLLAVDARAQTFVAPAVFEEASEAREPQLPSLSLIRTGSAREAADDSATPDTSTAELVMAASAPAPQVAAGHASLLTSSLRRAIRTLRRNPGEFEEQLDLTSAHPTVPIPETAVGEAVRVASIVADETAFAAVLTAASSEDRQELVRLRNDLLARIAALQSDDRVRARVFADGTIRGTAEGKQATQGVGTGSLAVMLQHRHQLWYAALTVASTEDTLTANFGPALLAPGSGKALSSGLLSVHYMDLLGRGWNLHPYVSTSRHLWSVKDTARSATVLGLGMLLHRELGTEQVGGKQVSLAVELGPTSRFLGGDVLDLDETTRDTGIGTSNTAFFGIESGATLSVGDLVGSVQLYYLFGDDEDRVLGLSNLQLVAGFSVKGELFRP